MNPNGNPNEVTTSFLLETNGAVTKALCNQRLNHHLPASLRNVLKAVTDVVQTADDPNYRAEKLLDTIPTDRVSHDLKMLVASGIDSRDKITACAYYLTYIPKLAGSTNMSTQALQAFALETFEAMITVRLVSAIQLDELQQELEEAKRERDDYKKKYKQQSVRAANLEIETWRLRRKRKRLAALAEEATAAGNIV
jgi:hypothetical protein